MGCSSGPDIIQDGLVLCLDAGSKRSYSGSGTAFVSLAGSASGVLTNMNSSNLSSDHAGCFVFDGTDEYIDLESVDTSLFDDEATISLFLSLDNATPASYKGGLMTFGEVVSSAQSSTYPATHYSWTNGNMYTSIFRNVRIENFSLSSEVNRENMHMLTFTSKPGANNWKFYQNLNLVKQTTGDNTINISSREIGRSINDRRDITGNPLDLTYIYLDGKIASVLLYNRALTADEVRQNYLSTKERFA